MFGNDRITRKFMRGLTDEDRELTEKMQAASERMLNYIKRQK
jgi:hypothetical protein